MTGMMNPKAERARPQWAPTATVTTPSGVQFVWCHDCHDTLRTSYPPLARQFRDWHLIQHHHKDREEGA